MPQINRKGLYQALENRILAGERKADIYAEFADELDASLVANTLSQIPTSRRRQDAKILNRTLVILLGLLALGKVLVAAILVRDTPKLAWLILLAPALNVLMMLLVEQFRGLGYMLVIGFGGASIGKAAQNLGRVATPREFGFVVLDLVAILICVILAWTLRKQLLPETGWSGPTKDASGRPIFED